MTVRIVTDSLSDLTSNLIGKLDIILVPLTVLFGHETYLDRVTISTDEFYHRLIYGDIWPTSSQPSPQDFANTYDQLSENTNEILVINASPIVNRILYTIRWAPKNYSLIFSSSWLSPSILLMYLHRQGALGILNCSGFS